ncbi:hypothetical protein [Brevundimonas sp.]|uniref:hypothetical protein n=1 Tax=Brevundimonas sp. TaxID=1871086 RepID=UPI00378461D0
MARRLNVQRLMLVMAALVLALGGVCAWVIYDNARPAPQPTAGERAVRQLREQRGPEAEVRYAEAGRGRALCGYAGVRGQATAVAFVSRPNRILFSDDPMPVEFREVQQRFCPTFLSQPSAPNSVNSVPGS